MEEIWKDVVGYEGLYKVSNLGRVKSLKGYHRKDCILKLRNNLYGYLTVGLSKHNKSKRIKVHRLVAETFIPNPQNYEQVNHIDGNKLNNNVLNLEWCNRSYNMKHAYDNNLLSCVPINQYDKEGNFIKTWKGAKYVTEELGIWNSNIVKCCQGERNSAGGYKWRYADDIRELIG